MTLSNFYSTRWCSVSQKWFETFRNTHRAHSADKSRQISWCRAEPSQAETHPPHCLPTERSCQIKQAERSQDNLGRRKNRIGSWNCSRYTSGVCTRSHLLSWGMLSALKRAFPNSPLSPNHTGVFPERCFLKSRWGKQEHSSPCRTVLQQSGATSGLGHPWHHAGFPEAAAKMGAGSAPGGESQWLRASGRATNTPPWAAPGHFLHWDTHQGGANPQSQLWQTPLYLGTDQSKSRGIARLANL